MNRDENNLHSPIPSTESGKPVHRTIAIIFGLAICYFPMYVNPVNQALGIDIGPEGPPSIILWNWLAVGALLGLVVLIERRTLASILIKLPSAKDIRTALLFWGIAMAWSWLAMMLWPLEGDTGTATLVALSIPVLLAMIVTAAITEEILFRGYPIERINELTSSKWIGVAVSFVIFLVPHVNFFGPSWLIYHGSGMVMIYALYIYRRNLVACMLLHFLVNVPILIPASGLFG
jgi:uncharacterized protein